MVDCAVNTAGKVSLFTREWIEIQSARCGRFVREMSPSLRGSGLKYRTLNDNLKTILSPSLRGSGLKWGFYWVTSVSHVVSLFTREWIEIFRFYRCD